MVLKNLKILFQKQVILGISLIAFFILINSFLIYNLFIVKPLYFVEYLSRSQRLGIIIFLFLSFVTYECLFTTKATYFSAIPSLDISGKNNAFFGQLFVAFMILIGYSFIIIGYNIVAYFMYSVNYPSCIIHIIKCILLNIVYVGIIGILLSANLVVSLKRIPFYLVIAIVTLLINSSLDPIISTIEDRIPNINLLFDLYKISVPNLTWVSDALYGISIERYRWNIAYFWIILFFIIILLKTKNFKNGLFQVVFITLAIFFIFNAIDITGSYNDSIIRKDERADSIICNDYYYWSKHEVKRKEADFDVNEYNISLALNRNLQAIVEMLIQTSEGKNIYSFTLYRGYNITKITDSNNNMLKFVRDGDYFDILSSFNNPTEKIKVYYQGSGGKYYSNSQGILLPGYFPFYPMPGYKATWNTNKDAVNVDTFFSNKEFSVRIISPLHIVSNLTEVDNNFFKGVSPTVTLMGGFIVEESKNNYTYIYSPIAKPSLDFSYLEENWIQLRKQLGIEKEYGFKNKKIFMIPATIIAATGSEDEEFIYLGDHIMTYNFNAEYMYGGLINSTIEYKESEQLLKSTFLNYLGSRYDNAKRVKKPLYSSLEILKTNIEEMVRDDAVLKYYEAEKHFADLFLYKIQTFGEEYVLNSIYMYLRNRDNHINEVDFLFLLGEEK